MKPQRFRPGRAASHEPFKILKPAELLIRKKLFVGTMREIGAEIGATRYNLGSGFWFTSVSIEALETAPEYFLTGLNEHVNLCAIHRQRVAVQSKFMKLKV